LGAPEKSRFTTSRGSPPSRCLGISRHQSPHPEPGPRPPKPLRVSACSIAHVPLPDGPPPGITGADSFRLRFSYIPSFSRLSRRCMREWLLGVTEEGDPPTPLLYTEGPASRFPNRLAIGRDFGQHPRRCIIVRSSTVRRLGRLATQCAVPPSHRPIGRVARSYSLCTGPIYVATPQSPTPSSPPPRPTQPRPPADRCTVF